MSWIKPMTEAYSAGMEVRVRPNDFVECYRQGCSHRAKNQGDSMLYLVTRWNGSQQVCIQRDGTEEPDRDQCDLFNHEEALAVAKQFGGFLRSEAEVFTQDWDLDDPFDDPGFPDDCQ